MAEPDNFGGLRALERIARYRELAARAADMAAKATTSDAQKSFLMVCSGWHALADKLEKDIGPS